MIHSLPSGSFILLCSQYSGEVASTNGDTRRNRRPSDISADIRDKCLEFGSNWTPILFRTSRLNSSSHGRRSVFSPLCDVTPLQSLRASRGGLRGTFCLLAFYCIIDIIDCFFTLELTLPLEVCSLQPFFVPMTVHGVLSFFKEMKRFRVETKKYSAFFKENQIEKPH